MGAVPNINTPSPVNEDNATKSVIQTHGGNIISMEDTPGKAHIKMGIHDDLCTMVMHNDDGDDGEYGIAWKTGGFWKVGSVDCSNTILGNKEEFVAGLKEDVMVGGVLELSAAGKSEFTFGGLFELIKGKQKTLTPERKALVKKVTNVTLATTNINKKIKNITEEHTHVTNKHYNITRTITEVVSEQRIAEIAKQIMSSKNFVETIASKTLSAESVKTIVQNEVKQINASVGKFESDIKHISKAIQEMDALFKKVKTRGDKTATALYISNIAQHQNKITIYN